MERNRLDRFLVIILVLIGETSSLVSMVQFSNRGSAVRINPGSNLNLITPLSAWQGTLEDRGSLSGNMGVNDIVLNARTVLTNTWYFGQDSTRPQSYLDGAGNVLDLDITGTIWIKRGTTLFLNDLTLRGLGNGKGSIVFEDATSHLRLGNVTIELSNNYSVTQGGFYVDGPSTIVTNNFNLTFALSGSLTVDGVTMWYDTLGTPNANNIIPANTGASITNITLLNNGRVALIGSDNSLLIVQTSNALVEKTQEIANSSNAIISAVNRLTTDEANIASLQTLTRTTSNEVVILASRVNADSNAILLLSTNMNNNSNAIIAAVTRLTSDEANISNLGILAIANQQSINTITTQLTTDEGIIRTTSNALLFKTQEIVNSSNAIIAVGNRLTVDETNISNLITNQIADELLLRTTSNALLEKTQQILNNSNAIILLAAQANTAISCCNLVQQSSNAIIAAVNRLTTDESNISTIMSNQITDEANIAFLQALARTTSNEVVNLASNLSNCSNAIALLATKMNNNSNAIIAVVNRLTTDETNITNLTTNQSADELLLRTTSNALLVKAQEIANSSNAIIAAVNRLTTDETNISNLTFNQTADELILRTTSNALSEKVQEITNNSNAIIFLAAEANAAIACCNLVQQSSNAIVALENRLTLDENTINTVINNQIVDEALLIATSNAVSNQGLNQAIINNSNAILLLSGREESDNSLSNNNSNSIIALNNRLAIDEAVISNLGFIVLTNQTAINNIENQLDIDEEFIRTTSNALTEKCIEIAAHSNLINYLIDNGTNIRNIAINDGDVFFLTNDIYLHRSEPAKSIMVTGNGILDGQNNTIRFATDSGLISISDGSSLIIRNAVLVGFSPSHINLNNSGQILFGDGVQLRLAPNQSDIIGCGSVMDLNYTWSFIGNSMLIDGQGHELILNAQDSITLVSSGTLSIQNIGISGVGGYQNSNDCTNIKTLNPLGTICFENVELTLSNQWSYTQGFMNFLSDVSLSGAGNTFAYQSNGLGIVKNDALLLIDYDVTFSYDPLQNARKDYFRVAEGGMLYMRGSTLHSTYTGLHLTQGTIVIDNHVTFSSEASGDAEAFEIDDVVRVKILSGALLDIFGRLKIMC